MQLNSDATLKTLKTCFLLSAQGSHFLSRVEFRRKKKYSVSLQHKPVGQSDDWPAMDLTSPFLVKLLQPFKN